MGYIIKLAQFEFELWLLRGPFLKSHFFILLLSCSLSFFTDIKILFAYLNLVSTFFLLKLYSTDNLEIKNYFYSSHNISLTLVHTVKILLLHGLFSINFMITKLFWSELNYGDIQIIISLTISSLILCTFLPTIKNFSKILLWILISGIVYIFAVFVSFVVLLIALLFTLFVFIGRLYRYE